ncbi:MAG: hypothetical protein HRT66_12485 [Flavobacteriaceae bacterium]|nr:hypothetical protein [Flavobacteriaceae bacterium]
MYYTTKKKNTINAFIENTYSEDNPFYNSITGFQRFEIIPSFNDINDTNFKYNMTQLKSVKDRKTKGSINYYHTINDMSHLNISLGTDINKQGLKSHIYQELEGKTVLNFDQENLNNDASYSFIDNFLGVHYKLEIGKLTLRPGIVLHNYKSENSQYSTVTKVHKSMIAPSFKVYYQIGKSESIRFSYSIKNNFTNINNLAQGHILRSYNSIFRGNSNLDKSISESYSLRYFSFQSYNYTNIIASIRYSNRKYNLKSDSDITGIDAVNTLVNLSDPEESISANIGYGRSFYSLFKLNLDSRYRWSNNNGVQNSEVVNSISENQNYSTSLRTTFSEFPNISLEYDYNINEYENSGEVRVFTTSSYSADIEAIFLKSFTFRARYRYSDYESKDGSINNPSRSLTSSLFYNKKDSHWEFNVRGTNLLNNSSISKDSSSGSFISSTQNYVQPKYIIFSVRYSL